MTDAELESMLHEAVQRFNAAVQDLARRGVQKDVQLHVSIEPHSPNGPIQVTEIECR